MSVLSTSGTASCAAISISGFKSGDVIINKEYVETGKFTLKSGGGFTVDRFYTRILHPVEQRLGKTKSYPFQKLMEMISETQMDDKYTTVLLNSYQNMGNDEYWPKQLEKWEFKLADKTKNNIGTVCYIYVRNLARVKL